MKDYKSRKEFDAHSKYNHKKGDKKMKVLTEKCKRCDGSGKDPQFSSLNEMREKMFAIGYSYEYKGSSNMPADFKPEKTYVACKKCKGHGKVDWVENVITKEPKSLEHYPVAFENWNEIQELEIWFHLSWIRSGSSCKTFFKKDDLEPEMIKRIEELEGKWYDWDDDYDYHESLIDCIDELEMYEREGLIDLSGEISMFHPFCGTLMVIESYFDSDYYWEVNNIVYEIDDIMDDVDNNDKIEFTTSLTRIMKDSYEFGYDLKSKKEIREFQTELIHRIDSIMNDELYRFYRLDLKPRLMWLKENKLEKFIRFEREPKPVVYNVPCGVLTI